MLAKGFDVPDVECVCDVRPLLQKPERSNPDVGRGSSIVAEYRQERLPAAGFQRQHHPHGGRPQRCFFGNGPDALDKRKSSTRRYAGIKRKNRRESLSDLRIQADGQALRIVDTRRLRHRWSSTSTAKCEVCIGNQSMPTTSAICGNKRHRMPRIFCSGKQQGRASHIYREITGEWPDRSWTVANTPSVPITRAVLNKIRSRISPMRQSEGRGMRFEDFAAEHGLIVRHVEYGDLAARSYGRSSGKKRRIPAPGRVRVCPESRDDERGYVACGRH